MTVDEVEQVGRITELLRSELEGLLARGLASSTAKDRRPIADAAEQWSRLGAGHVASRLSAAILASDGGRPDAAALWLSAYTSLHTFERVLSLDVASRGFAGLLGDAMPEASTRIDAPPPAMPEVAGTASALEDLVRVVEDLVRTGLTSATTATRQKLDAAFKEASRRKQLRLGASLRYANEEVGRFLADDGTFAVRRYGFFLHRSWMLAKGTLAALARGDMRAVGALTSGASVPATPVKHLEVVTLGIGKRTIASACTFDFRLRVLAASDSTLVGKALVFGLVFGRKPGVIAEAYLHLPQPQKYTPKILLGRERVVITDAAVLPDDRGGRLVLGPKSTVTVGPLHERWSELATWDPAAAARRLISHAPSPLDLPVEMQEEVVLADFQLMPSPDPKHPFVLEHGPLTMSVTAETEEARAWLEKARTAPPGPLFGSVHYELGRLVLQPLSFVPPEGPIHLQLSDETINLTALVGSLNIG